MSKLRFVFGPSGSGKSTTIYREILERAAREPARNFLVIVPDQFTMQTQKTLVQMSPTGGILNVDVLSFGRLTHRILEEVGMESLPVLDDTGKSLVLQKVGSAMEEQLPTLGRRMHMQGYVHQVKSAISEFMTYGIGPDDVDTLLACSGGRGSLKAKLTDLQTIYRAFNEYLEGRFITREGKLDLLRRALPQSQLIPDSVLVFDGFTGFTPNQRAVIGDLLALSGELIVTLALGAGVDPFAPCEPEALFALTHRTAASLLKLAEDAGAERGEDLYTDHPAQQPWMQHLERSIFRFPTEHFQGQPEGLYLNEMTDIAEEAHQVALEIFRLTRTGGYAYREIAVVSGDQSTYAPYLEREFNRLGIPAYLDRTTGASKNPLPELISSALEVLLDHYSIPAVCRFLRSGLSGFTSDEADRLENYIRSAGIRSRKRWERTFRPLDAKATKKQDEKSEEAYFALNALRERFLALMEPLENAGKTAAELVSALYDFLLGLKVEEQLFAMEDAFHESKDPEREKEYGTIYGLVLELLDQIHALIGEEKLSLRDFSEILNAGFGEIRVGTIPQSIDRVAVGDMERTRLNGVKVLFFMGVNDGNIPRIANGGGILSDLDREFLQEMGMELAPTPKEEMYTQRLYLYLNLTKPSEKLYLSYASLGVDGKELRPSYLTEVLRDLFPALQTGHPHRRPMLEQVVTPEEGLRYLADGLREAVARSGSGENAAAGESKAEGEKQEQKELYTLYEAYRKHAPEKGQKLFDAAFLRYDPIPLNPEIVQKLYGRELAISVSRLESFAGCAYRFFLTYGLKLKEDGDFEVTALDRGNVAHDVLDLFGRGLKEHGLDWTTFTEEYLDEVLPGLLHDVAAGYNGALYFDNERNAGQLALLESILRNNLLFLQYQVQKGGYVPSAYELPFEREESALGGAAKVRMQGRVDRMDLAEDGENLYVKILDYKTGDKDVNLGKIYSGEQLQLPLYMGQELERLSGEHPGKTVKPGAMLYYRVTEPVVKEEGAVLTEPERIRDVRSEMRPKGMILDTTGNCILIDREVAPFYASDVAKIKLNKDGSFGKGCDVFPEETMDLVIRYAQKLSMDMAERILKGDIEIRPTDDTMRTTCDYCDYRESCPFDRNIPGFRIRLQKKEEDDQILEQMKNYCEES